MAHHIDMLMDQKIVSRGQRDDLITNIWCNLIITVAWLATMLVLYVVLFLDWRK